MKSSGEDYIREDRALFSSLLKRIVQAAPNEDPSDFVLESIGRSVGADRCYVYRFWEPGKSSMCTNTHEWCAEGIKPEIGGLQTCNLEDLVEFNGLPLHGHQRHRRRLARMARAAGHPVAHRDAAHGGEQHDLRFRGV